MNGRRAVVGLCMLCALLVSALAAQGASAAGTKGTTAYTCTNSGLGTPVGNKFKDAHCKEVDNTNGTFRHVEIAANTTTELSGSNETTGGAKENTLLKATIAGSAFTLTGTETTGSGWMTNATEGKEHYAHGEGTITYSGVTASGGCKVFTDSGAGKGAEGVIHTEPLKATTKGQGDALKFEPKEGTVFARFLLEGCTNTGINGTYTVTGSVKTTSIEGATSKFTHANTTEQNTLKLNGTIKAGIEGVLTLKSRSVATDPYTALSATTVETE
ncbi:MAG TPA: hypothetical protein VFX45_12240 [Solirubrobacterales bacterium]|nr:hypothetical protein [Solirubrobacterales bacterium]